ncbi:hypothetical protein PHYC_03260 [Phycisphaerales bacterium]|nr:hypothetical protein PHYC_03260 [Phycisphaerales bacterium]
MNLPDTLALVFKGKAMNAEQATAAVLAAGYRTPARSFRKMVVKDLSMKARSERVRDVCTAK